MEALNYPLSLMKTLLSSSSLFFILITCFLEITNAFQASIKDTENLKHYHTVEITSLLPASVCTPSITGFNKRQSTLEVTHQHGPCSKHVHGDTVTAPSLSEILSNDQSRVDSLHARINPQLNTNKIKGTGSRTHRVSDKKASLPAESGRSLGSGNYIVVIGLGTPLRRLSLQFDTGSDLTWTQCEPCARSCYQQKEPIFDPSTSSSYLNISCSSQECGQLLGATGINPGCSSSTCVYGIRYGDQSSSVGFFSRDKLALTATEVISNFIFGCGQNNRGLFGNTAGILGLGRDPVSIVSQTAPKYGKYFSYCLPPTSSSRGFLELGRSGSSSHVRFTPFSSSRSKELYFIDIQSITVGGLKLPISQSVFTTAGSIIDSGTVITRLPPAAYGAMRAAFRKGMAQYKSAPAFSILDTCYDFSGLTTVTIPTISFTFSGSVKIDLHPTGVLIGVGNSVLCLAFSANNYDTSVGIFGNTQQKTFEIVYDVAGGRLGFGPGGC
ncbi:aspartyl protease family protein At5g10770-like [Andrographis paniculata]|uniref:aspartyl protease family protein At5g10770-like n=1 Tax=Andrographis paniculata TaxID=175694 RepID=UPI0021E7E5B5|nr:aspartyl protease family protein At5g10770-like [Andrographis paniculata]